jgi:outer membrane protein assembly complex protein YaeT
MLADASAWQALAQTAKYEGLNVVTIQFAPRDQPLDPSELFEILPLKVKRPLRMTDVRASIERLYATGRYKDIKVDAEPYNGGVIVRFLTEPTWFIGNVSVVGNVSESPNPGQLENAARLDLGTLYTDDKLKQAVAGIERLLVSNGLYHNAVKPELKYDRSTQLVNIQFLVDGGDRARYSEPTLQGDLKAPYEKLLDATGWRWWLIHRWKPVTQSRTRHGLDGILKLYQKQERLEAQVTLDSMRFEAGANRVSPALTVEAGPRIEVRTIGAKVPKRVLKRYVPIYEERAVDQDLLVEGARNLRDYFQSNGYFETQVAVKQQRVTNDKGTIDYLINTGRRHRLVAIFISGNKYFNTQTIRERMFLEPKSFLQFRRGRFSENLLRRDEGSITSLYQSNGFRDVKVTHRIQDDYQGRSGDIAVFIHIDEGPQYFVNSLEVEGIVKLPKAPILASLSSTGGQPFSEFNVAVDRDLILARYFENGFPNATFEWSSKPAAQPERVDLRYVIHEGDQQFVRQVLISGLRRTRPSLVNRNLRINPGDPLSPLAITETQRRLYDLGVFSRVDAAIQNPEGETPRKNVLFEMDEARRYSMAVGVGAEITRIGGCQTCLEAPTGQAGVFPRVSLDLARLNLWGLAHSITFRGRASNLQDRALLTYTAPRIANRDGLTLSVSGLYEESRDIRTFTSKRQEGSVQLSQRLSKTTTLLYRYAYRRVSIDQGTLKITPFLIPLFSQPVHLGIVSLNLIYDRRDDPIDPHKGTYNTVDLGLAEHIFGSQVNFVRFLGRNATYHQLTRKLILARSTEIGDIQSFLFSGDSVQAIPLPERFFAGGGTSNRGFPEYQAGPRDLVTGFPLGGTALLFNQTELRFPLIGYNIGGVFFHDAGNVFSRFGRITWRVTQQNIQDFDYMVHAVGIGVRYRTPIGPLRLDLAYSINPPTFIGYNGSLQDLLNAGVNPCDTPGRCTPQNISHFQFFFSIGQTF